MSETPPEIEPETLPSLTLATPFTLAIVGRPNVGKSTLFNRLVGRRAALVDDKPGVTRDRRFGDASLGELRFRIIDTAGFEDGKAGTLIANMREQTEMAVQEADMVLFLTDAIAGILPEDEAFARLLRVHNVPLILAANKAESARGVAGVQEAYRLGFGEAITLSAEHGHGMDAIYTILREAMPRDEFDDIDEDLDENFDSDTPFVDDINKPLRVAVIGRPNAGKSTLINHLLQQNRLLTSPEAGTTRDSISVDWIWKSEQGDRLIMLWDTAGIRRKARVQKKIEKLSVADALRAVRFAEVVVLMMDIDSPFDKQDVQLADLIAREGRALVIGLNKCDTDYSAGIIDELVEDKFRYALSHWRGLPILKLSAKTGKGMARLMPAVQHQYELWNTRISTAKLNKWLEEVTSNHPPPADRGRPVRLRYMTQAKSRPPTFIIFSSRGKAVPESYKRYLINELRNHFNLDGCPIRLFLRQGTNPYGK
ncbi:MAG: ribosome biogenesis GTPase Der [Alphaproteobacteria bacterium]|nr:ribosome biogenesis GTPase Der [Alphaproteobacteria bacterium]MBE8220872.1 ribosome biogenesis GTPase Der [Alphaproteobacteria bacterium]